MLEDLPTELLEDIAEWVRIFLESSQHFADAFSYHRLLFDPSATSPQSFTVL
jgi:hypothetical protein